jgi:Concanavalin A-like lectin/glucanases superfamily
MPFRPFAGAGVAVLCVALTQGPGAARAKPDGNAWHIDGTTKDYIDFSSVQGLPEGDSPRTLMWESFLTHNTTDAWWNFMGMGERGCLETTSESSIGFTRHRDNSAIWATICHRGMNGPYNDWEVSTPMLRWFHFAFSFWIDSGSGQEQGTTYFNGVPVHTGRIPIWFWNTTHTPLSMFAWGMLASQDSNQVVSHPGYFDNLRIWNRVLSDEEVSAEWNSTTPANTTSLVANIDGSVDASGSTPFLIDQVEPNLLEGGTHNQYVTHLAPVGPFCTSV